MNNPTPGTWWRATNNPDRLVRVAYITVDAVHFTDGTCTDHPWRNTHWAHVPADELADALADQAWRTWGHGPPAETRSALVRNMMRALMATLTDTGAI